MKNKFKGYHILTEGEIQNIWKDGFISLDTNVLFNIYRYSDETRRELLKVISKYSTQLWLSNHSAFEFHKNRISVITDQIEIYDNTIKTVKKLENDIAKNLKTPHLSKSILKQFEKTIKAILRDFDKKKRFYEGLLKNDTILNSISSIFNNKVGDAFTGDELTKIEKEGEERYKKKIPPGFKDDIKNQNKYGDLIIWKELIKKAKFENKSFIFIIDDLKEDWWIKFQGKIISPRQELSQELYIETQKQFYLYTPDRFLEFAGKSGNVKQQTINEVREIRLEGSPFFNPESNSIYSTSSLTNFLNGNKKFDNLQQINTFGEIIKKDELINNLGGLKNIADFTSKWGEANPISDIIKKSQFNYLGAIQKMAELNNSLNSIFRPLSNGYQSEEEIKKQNNKESEN